MKKVRYIFWITFILSLSLNAAFILHLFTSMDTSKNPTVNPSQTKSPVQKPNLELTTDQLKKMEPFQLKIHRENETIKKEIRQYQVKLLASINKEPIDKQAINRCIDRINNLQKKIQQNTVKEILYLKKHMNPDQCNCFIKNLGDSMIKSSSPCNCPNCKSYKQ